MHVFPIWMILLLAILAGIVVALIKAPKLMLGLLGFGLLALVPLWFFAPDRVEQKVAIASEEQARAISSAQAISGVRAQASIIVSLDGPSTAPAEASGKRWIDDWQNYINSNNRNQPRLRAGSTSPWGSEEDARRDARLQAAISLYPYISNYVHTSGRVFIGRRAVPRDEWLREQLQQSIMQGQFVVDEHVTCTEHPYGQTWTCQFLLDASSSTIRQAADRYNRIARQQMESTAITWGGLAGLTLVIVMLYAFLNSVTKGYFMWRLRAAAAMIVIIALLVVMSVA